MSSSIYGDAEIDALVDRLEAGGLNSYVLESAHFTFLAFEPVRPPVTFDALAAATILADMFKASDVLRERMKLEAIGLGSFFRAV